MANVPFANAPQHTSSLTGDYLIGIQVGITQDAAGLPEMKYIKLSQLKNFLALEYGRLWNYRGEFDSITGIPSNPALNDSFYCSGTFTEDGVTYTAGHLYAYNADGDWGDISGVLNQYALANNVYSKIEADALFIPKDTDAVPGNFAIFDANGDTVDANSKPSDYVLKTTFNSLGLSVVNGVLCQTFSA